MCVIQNKVSSPRQRSIVVLLGSLLDLFSTLALGLEFAAKKKSDQIFCSSDIYNQMGEAFSGTRRELGGERSEIKKLCRTGALFENVGVSFPNRGFSLTCLLTPRKGCCSRDLSNWPPNHCLGFNIDPHSRARVGAICYLTRSSEQNIRYQGFTFRSGPWTIYRSLI